MNRYFLFAIALVLAVTGCRKSKTESASNQSNETKIVACSLITNDEVQKIQGSPVKDIKPSESAKTKPLAISINGIENLLIPGFL